MYSNVSPLWGHPQPVGGGLNPFNPPGKSNTHWTREHRETRDACALTHG